MTIAQQLPVIPKVVNSTFRTGTPSLADPKTFEAVLKTVASEARLTPAAEISMEINPTSIETKKLR